eukprot:TRINITY_DN2359_c0_g2_i2.p1 TRINITY_DN2359_c0_g2~~TRINITY_DN2359_c0_g2_i2.p1  ORF type:complete len:275 (+),score=46.47 TRINITY_DN2359_c0_g2_i2:1239-2063(+)
MEQQQRLKIESMQSLMEENDKKIAELKKIIKKLEVDNKELHEVCIKKQAENDHLKKNLLDKCAMVDEYRKSGTQSKENAPPTATSRAAESAKPQFQEIYNKIVRGLPGRNESHKSYVESSKIALDKKKLVHASMHAKDSVSRRPVSQLKEDRRNLIENTRISIVLWLRIAIEEEEGNRQCKHKVGVQGNSRSESSAERGTAGSCQRQGTRRLFTGQDPRWRSTREGRTRLTEKCAETEPQATPSTQCDTMAKSVRACRSIRTLIRSLRLSSSYN